MLNRYGPWLDLNIVEPTGPESCQVQFEYFHEQAAEPDASYVQVSNSGAAGTPSVHPRPHISHESLTAWLQHLTALDFVFSFKSGVLSVVAYRYAVMQCSCVIPYH